MITDPLDVLVEQFFNTSTSSFPIHTHPIVHEFTVSVNQHRRKHIKIDIIVSKFFRVFVLISVFLVISVGVIFVFFSC